MLKLHGAAADRSYGNFSAGILAENAVDFAAEKVKIRMRHKRLNRPAEAASVYSHGTALAEKSLAQRYCECRRLIFGVLFGMDVLKKGLR